MSIAELKGEAEGKGDLAAWQSRLWKRPLSENILRWQHGWTEKCGRACCWSSMCGSQQCGKCAQQLVSRIPPLPRYVCMGCDFGGADCSDNPGMQMCGTCFLNPQRLHHHRMFCLVSPTGAHSAVTRTGGFATPVEVTAKDLVINQRPPSEDESCAVCMADFDEETGKPVSLPGCKAEHGIALSSEREGLRDSGTRFCASCCLKWIAASGQVYYRGSPLESLCELCRQEATEKAWQAEFECGRKAIQEFYASPEKARNWSSFVLELTSRLNLPPESISLEPLARGECVQRARLALKELHKQLWIQRIIDHVLDTCA